MVSFMKKILKSFMFHIFSFELYVRYRNMYNNVWFVSCYLQSTKVTTSLARAKVIW